MLRLSSVAILLLFAATAFAQSPATIEVPPFNDDYSHTVRKLETGDTSGVDFQAFRKSFLESEQFKIAFGEKEIFDSLKREMRAAMDASNYPSIIAIAKAMLSIDYTNMLAHGILAKTYGIVKDSVHQKRSHDIEFGLLHSILDHGDGKTCATGWPVIQVSEEYFVLSMMKAKVNGQALADDGGLCDRMSVTTEEGEKTYYFDVSDVFQGYSKLGIH